MEDAKNKILIVDDMQTNLELLKTYLKDEEYMVATVKSAKSALIKLKSHQFDLILLDIIMPVMDGIELCKLLKKDESTKHIPVIFLTAISTDEIIIEAFDAGGVDYIKKPFNPYELKKKIANHLELINYRKDLEKAMKKANLANQAKSRFLNNISHELRTPLNGIVATLEMLGETQLEENQKEMLNIAIVSAEHLTRILNDLLDLTRVESGALKIENKPFSPRKMAGIIKTIFINTANQKNLKLKLDYDENIPETLIGDQYRTQQILSQIIDNALKFTTQGQIIIQIKLIKYIPSETIIQYCVKDDGIGISSQEQETIFDTFTQIDSRNTRLSGGMGSGLALAKKIALLMGGNIKVESQINKGSTFCFTLTYKNKLESSDSHSQNILSKTTHKNYKDIKVLVVDDNVVNLKVAQMMLNRMGLSVHLAENGVEALSKYEIHQPDLILMDIQMPKMDGIETTRRIRNIELEKKVKMPIPIIALTASAMKGDKEFFLSSNMNDYISKPFRKEDLKRILEEFF